jgi:hypothetical protein
LALTYLPEPFVVLTALAWGVRGGSLSLLALSAVSLHSMSQGDGHFISLQNGLEESVYELQLYLAITALMALLIAAMRSEQDRALRESDAWRVRYEAASTAAGQVVFDVDPATGGVVWGDNVEAVLGEAAAARHDRQAHRARRRLGACPAAADVRRAARIRIGGTRRSHRVARTSRFDAGRIRRARYRGFRRTHLSHCRHGAHRCRRGALNRRSDILRHSHGFL